MRFPVIKKTKSGYSVDGGVLQELKKKTAHKLFDELLQYRKTEKMYSTYIKGLQNGLDPVGRVHTSFWQIVSTGRMSSSSPNMQNLPKGIRRAIIPEKGNVLLSLDYSQVELRVMAYMSGDEILLDSFQSKEDIHKRTASEIYGCGLDQVTDKMREHGKTMNFSLIYGSTEYGIAYGLGISVEKALQFIEKYFSYCRIILNR